jgi:hypothetical protein
MTVVNLSEVQTKRPLPWAPCLSLILLTLNPYVAPASRFDSEKLAFWFAVYVWTVSIHGPGNTNAKDAVRFPIVNFAMIFGYS